MISKDILHGIYDMHLHVGPSVADRELDAAEMLWQAQDAGYGGFLIKDHYFPTMMTATTITQRFGNGNCRVFGSIVLNHSVGLFNLKAVDAARQMDAKMVFFPTISCRNHLEAHKGKPFIGGGRDTVPDEPVVYVDSRGRMDPAAAAVLRFMGEHDMALGTGHGSLWEVDHLIRKAFELGIQRILVNHPHYLVGASYDDMARWAKMGAYIEVNACVFKSGSSHGTIDDDAAHAMIEACGPERILLNSDMGQAGNGSPVTGLYRFIYLLMAKYGVTEEQINLMAKANPVLLFDL